MSVLIGPRAQARYAQWFEVPDVAGDDDLSGGLRDTPVTAISSDSYTTLLDATSGRADVRYPGHEELPEIPLGTDDQLWLPVVGALGLIVLGRDRRIRSRPAELRTYHEHGVRSVWIGAKQDLGPQQQLEIFLQHEERLKREIVKRAPGPWAVAMSPSGVRPLQLRPNPGARPPA